MRLTILLILLAAGVRAQTPAPAAGHQLEPGLYATLRTSMGDIFIKFFETETPVTVQNFVDLARGTKEWKDPKTHKTVKRPLYAGTIFHRVKPGFMIQGGDPAGTGISEIGYTIPEEFVPTLKFDQPGRVGMARTSEPHTGSSQFFITEVATPHLNGTHTIFGQVVDGQEVVNQIAHVSTNSKDKPLKPVMLQAIIFRREGPVPPGGVAMKGITPAKTAPVRKSGPAGSR